MPGSQIRQEAMEVAISDLKGKPMADKLAKVMVNPFDEPGVEPIKDLTKGSY